MAASPMFLNSTHSPSVPSDSTSLILTLPFFSSFPAEEEVESEGAGEVDVEADSEGLEEEEPADAVSLTVSLIRGVVFSEGFSLSVVSLTEGFVPQEARRETRLREESFFFSFFFPFSVTYVGIIRKNENPLLPGTCKAL